MNCGARTGASSLSWAIRLYLAFLPAVIPDLLFAADVVPSVTVAARISRASASQTFGSTPEEPASTAFLRGFPSGSQPSGLQVLDGRMVACRAARNWTPAQALRARGRTVIQAYCEEDDCARQAAQSIAEFFSLQACQQEDTAAANALRAYYTRIALTEQMGLSDDARQVLEEEEAKQRAAQKSGLPTGTDLSSFARRRIEIEDQQLQLRAQDQQLRSLLTQLADLDYAMESVQQEQLDVRASTLDCQQLVAIALRRRYDMRSWNCLATHVNQSSASIFASLLTTAVGGFGLPLPTIAGLKSLLCPPDHEQLANNLKRELNLTIETNRRWIEQTVQEKCIKLELAYRRLALAQQTTASWEERREQLEQLEDFGKPQPEQSAAARVGWIQSRVEEISRRLDARLAEIDLAEATGELSRRCCAGQAWLVTGTENADS